MENPFAFGNTSSTTKMMGVTFSRVGGPLLVNGTSEPISIVVENGGGGAPPVTENVTLWV